MLQEISFDWDIWNIQKNEMKHGVSQLEAESVFYDKKLAIFDDIKHSAAEVRWIAYGKSKYNNILMLAFTIRNKKIRIISARRASKNERGVYNEN